MFLSRQAVAFEQILASPETLKDITERRIQEEKSRRLALLEQREEFMATLTHDLKNPLIGANRVLELMADNYIEPISQRHSQLFCSRSETATNVCCR